MSSDSAWRKLFIVLSEVFRYIGEEKRGVADTTETLQLLINHKPESLENPDINDVNVVQKIIDAIKIGKITLAKDGPTSDVLNDRVWDPTLVGRNKITGSILFRIVERDLINLALNPRIIFIFIFAGKTRKAVRATEKESIFFRELYDQVQNKEAEKFYQSFSQELAPIPKPGGAIHRMKCMK